jgi:NAD(P)-dependent dehydrogenase (short-subunit alcohol dehydrogenase family)
MSEVRRIAREFRSTHDRLHVLLNNAGALFATREVTAEGLERTLALNHLAYFVLTEELLPLLGSSAPARIVNVSSDAHRGLRLDLGDLGSARGRYRPFVAYGRSKLMNILFTRELARRLEGTGVTVNAMHPGFVRSGFGQNNEGFLQKFIKLGQAFARTPERGARTLVYLATSPAVEGVSGKYFHDERESRTSAAAQDMEVARRLWDASVGLAGPAAAAA